MDLGLPKMKISEEGDEVVIRIWISWIDEKDIKLDVQKNSLGVNVKKDFTKSTKDKDYVSREWKSSSFGAVISLPCKVVPARISHSYVKGVLEVRLKKEKVQTVRRGGK